MTNDTAPELFIGLMSGTSIDSIDAALVQFDENRVTIIASHEHPIPQNLKSDIVSLCQPGADEINRAGRADRQLGTLFAEAALALLKKNQIEKSMVTAIGSHGQTIRHHPTSKSTAAELAFTLQVGDPNTIAALTGITTVADFRSIDIALGGQGAPLAPAFHHAVFASTQHNRAVINIGGIANITFMPAKGDVIGFDCGPGNGLMDLWINRHFGKNYDEDGNWASQGTINEELLKLLLDETYFEWAPPKSTGRELFNDIWLDQKLALAPSLAPVDVQATLLEFTAKTIHNHLMALPESVSEIFLCGGGAYNKQLEVHLQALLKPAKVARSSDLGIEPSWVEATAFAWLAKQTLTNCTGNLPTVTGASSAAVLGAIYPGISH